MSPKQRFKPHIERAVLGFGIVNPALALPQVYNVWALGKVGGLSTVTISAGLIMAVLMAVWGAIEESITLWAPAAVWGVINAVLLLGVLHFT